jgi:hypothetical protein
MNMKRRMMWMSVIALAISLVAADIGQAQQKGGNRGGRSRGGFGGFGGGGRGGSQGPISLVGNQSIQKELELSQPQITAVAKLTEAYREEQRSGSGERPDIRALFELPEEERNKKIAELRQQGEERQKNLSAKFDPKVAELLDPPQADRLDQIVLQLKGVAALLGDDISKTLGLNQDQKTKIASLNADFDKQRGELFGGGRAGFGGGDRSRGQRGSKGGDRGKRGGDRGKRGGDGGGFGEVIQKMRELGEKRNADVLAVLTADQNTMFAALKGNPFDQQSLGGFGGGNRSRGGGGDRGKLGKRPSM